MGTWNYFLTCTLDLGPSRLVQHTSLGTRGVYLAVAYIQCFIVVIIAPETPDSKSAKCKAVTLGEIELYTV